MYPKGSEFNIKIVVLPQAIDAVAKAEVPVVDISILHNNTGETVKVSQGDDPSPKLYPQPWPPLSKKDRPTWLEFAVVIDGSSVRIKARDQDQDHQNYHAPVTVPLKEKLEGTFQAEITNHGRILVYKWKCVPYLGE